MRKGRDQRSAQAQAYRHLYKTARWRAVRAGQLAAEPLCASCLRQGKVTPATVCNHVDPKSKLTPEGFFAGPFSSLCAPCHDGPTQSEEKRGYSKAVDADGWPTDPRHPALR